MECVVPTGTGKGSEERREGGSLMVAVVVVEDEALGMMESVVVVVGGGRDMEGTSKEVVKVEGLSERIEGWVRRS